MNLKQEDGDKKTKSGTCGIQGYVMDCSEAAWHLCLTPFHYSAV